MLAFEVWFVATASEIGDASESATPFQRSRAGKRLGSLSVDLLVPGLGRILDEGIVEVLSVEETAPTTNRVADR